MQNKGALTALAVLLAIACAFQLSFSFVAGNVRNKAAKIANGDSAIEQAYLDSMKSQVVYNIGIVKYSYAECLEKEINLGLDLRGGMNVTLEIAVEDILKALSNDSADPAFNQAMAEAKRAQASSRDDFITLFADAYRKVAPEGRLSAIFGTYDMREKISPESTNEQVISVLRTESESAISNSFNVLSNRIDRFGVVQPNIQRLDNSGRILVELPGVKEPERVRKLLQGTASLEFWTTYTANTIAPMMMQANNTLAEILYHDQPQDDNAQTETSGEAQAETGESDPDIVSQLGETQQQADTSVNVADTKRFPLLGKLQISEYESAVIGHARSYDTAAVNTYLRMPQVRALFPRDIKFMWGIKGIDESNSVFELYAIKGTSDGKAPLDGGAVTDASGHYGQTGSKAEVSMTMNAVGAKQWARLTEDNVGKAIAIVLDDYVYSCPNVSQAITGGQSQITGNFTIAEARDLANVLKSGKLPAPARIVQEAVVGPSLGQESIDAGISSFILAFVLVLLYMFIFYSTGGFVANIALITNLFFLFGVLVSFGAVLTLPGIAGIVLTMGMAVDANVIIYERIKEELRAGKGLGMSLRDGFKHAYSAIIDGNATTLITGIVLFIFGSGPVQGFATTLIIGILTSLFCAIFVARLVFEALLTKGKNISFSWKFTENFLQNTKIDFIGLRKIAYVISGIAILVSIISLSTHGLNYGVDFSGGRAFVVRFDQDITANDVRSALEEVFPEGSSVEVKQFGTKDQHQMRIITQYKYDDDSDGVTQEINEILYKALAPMYAAPLSTDEFYSTATNPNGIVSADAVGPSIAHDIKVNSFIAVMFSLMAIGLYIAARFRNWQYSVGAVVSLAHDALLTIGLFSLFWSVMPFNLTVDQSFIAAILTIIGYSINDTVVIFDRIREYQTLYPKRVARENINNATNSTLARTVNTAGTTLVTLLAIFIFGGEVIRGFIFALLFGIAIGTYSSLFIATPISYDCMVATDTAGSPEDVKARKKNKKK